LLSAIDLDRLAARFHELEADIHTQLMRDRFRDEHINFLRVADCRYRGQGHELRTPAPAGPIDESFGRQLRDAFDRQHARAYGHIYEGRDVQIVNIRVVGIGAVSRLRGQRIAGGVATPREGAMASRRRTVFDIDGFGAEAIDTPRYTRALLEAGNRIEGPAVIDQMDATTVIPPGFAGRVDGFGNLVITAT
jgi:N-methylhydantoinase A/oxoprolinase/acetone carboxylase beta subunit